MGYSSRVVGDRGEIQFEDFLLSLNWTAHATHRGDRGTDYIAFLDASGREQFASLGFQVKTRTELRPTTVRDGRVGFWHRESGKKAQHHPEYWISHDIPHFLILQELSGSSRYWQRLDAAHIEKTEKGFRVFVPISQVVGTEAPEEWLDIASRRASQRFETISRWDAAQSASIPKPDQYRFALLVPRLVAPHPNAGTRAPFGPAHALALCAMGNAKAWQRFSQAKGSVPHPGDALLNQETGWQLAGAVFELTTTGRTEALERLVVASSATDVANSARALLAAQRLEDARPEEALKWATTESEETTPEDAYWLATLRVAAYAAMGDVAATLREASDTLAGTASVKSDPTIRQLTASLLWAQFRYDDAQMKRLEPVLRAADHAANWWRNEHRASALSSAVQRMFDSWSQSSTLRFGGEYAAHDELFAVAFQARLGGAPSEARVAESILARVDLMTAPQTPQDVRSALVTLVLSGDQAPLRDALSLALQRYPLVAFDGLVAVAVRALDDVQLAQCGVTTLNALGPYASESERLVARSALVALLARTDTLNERRAIGSSVAQSVLDAIARVGLRLDPNETQVVIDWLLARDVSDSFHENACGSAIGVLDDLRGEIPATSRRMMLRRLASTRADSAKYWAIVSAIGKDTRAGRDRVAEGLRQGSDQAVRLVREFDGFSREQQEDLLRRAVQHLRGELQAPLPAGITLGGPDHARTAALCALGLRDEAAIETVLRYVSSASVPAYKKRSAMLLIADELPDAPWIRETALREAAFFLAGQRDAQGIPRHPDFGVEVGGAPERALLALPGTSTDTADKLIARLVTGSELEKRDAADSLARLADHDVVLACLAADASPRVRTHAARAIVVAVCTRPSAVDMLASALDHAIRSGGPRVGRTIGVTLEGVRENSSAIDAGVRLVSQLLEKSGY